MISRLSALFHFAISAYDNALSILPPSLHLPNSISSGPSTVPIFYSQPTHLGRCHTTTSGQLRAIYKRRQNNRGLAPNFPIIVCLLSAPHSVSAPASTMNSFPRRSPRFQQQANNDQSTFPSFSSASSTISTSHPSPTNDLLNQPQHYPLHFQSQFLSTPQSFEAPLPSPSATDLDSYMSSAQSQYSQQAMGGQSQQNQTTNTFQSSTTQNQSSQSQPSQRQQHHTSFSQPQRPNYPPTSVNGVPPGLPPDFLAEAAKRAQMACLMRDLGDVSL